MKKDAPWNICNMSVGVERCFAGFSRNLFTSGRGLICFWNLALILHQRGMVNGGSTCPFPLQRRDIADAAGMSRVHVARTLERLRERRLATMQDGVLVLLDRPRLADLARYVPIRVAAGRRAIV
jgi:CRP-like cAMP-binding protein